MTEIDRQERIIDYYPNRNHDGLIKRVEKIGEKTTEYYENRDDHVIYRSIRFSKNLNSKNKEIFVDNYVGARNVFKMT